MLIFSPSDASDILEEYQLEETLYQQSIKLETLIYLFSKTNKFKNPLAHKSFLQHEPSELPEFLSPNYKNERAKKRHFLAALRKLVSRKILSLVLFHGIFSFILHGTIIHDVQNRSISLLKVIERFFLWIQKCFQSKKGISWFCGGAVDLTLAW